MNTAAARHTGLPFVPQPAPDELLGSWLLRVAQLYGLGLTTLLSRLGARSTGDAQVPHWFAIDDSNVSLDALSAASCLSRVDLAAMAPPSCRPRWPEELGACVKCMAAAADAAQTVAWNRRWMNPLATVCRVHGTWLTPVAMRMLASVRHVDDFGSVVQHIAAAQALLDCELPCAGDALWLQDLCSARTDARLPWGKTRPNDLTRIVDGVARTLISASNSDDSACGPPANRRALAVKDFAFEPSAGQRAVMSLPTRLSQRQWVLARVAHVLRWAPEERTVHSSWSSASVEQLASMRGWPEGTLAWVCPEAAGLVRRQDELRRELSISPSYFKACSALLASIQ